MADRQLDDADDNRLIEAVHSGDRSAVDRLLRRHYNRIWALCRRLAGNDADAQDAAQEALIAIARGLEGFDGRAAFTTWSYRVATNACLDELRRRSRRPAPLVTGEMTVIEGSATEVVSFADQIADRQAIDTALAQLPEEFRVAVVLRDLCDFDYQEISAILGVPPGTVRSRIARGRARLAAYLDASRNRQHAAERPFPQP